MHRFVFGVARFEIELQVTSLPTNYEKVVNTTGIIYAAEERS